GGGPGRPRKPRQLPSPLPGMPGAGDQNRPGRAHPVLPPASDLAVGSGRSAGPEAATVVARSRAPTPGRRRGRHGPALVGPGDPRLPARLRSGLSRWPVCHRAVLQLPAGPPQARSGRAQRRTAQPLSGRGRLVPSPAPTAGLAWLPPVRLVGFPEPDLLAPSGGSRTRRAFPGNLLRAPPTRRPAYVANQRLGMGHHVAVAPG